MTIPVFCPDCGIFLGEDDSFAGVSLEGLAADIECPGIGKHAPPVETRKQKWFGLVEAVTILYPEIGTSFSWENYLGPKHPFYVWLVLACKPRGRGVFINGKQCWWNFGFGFYGDGAKEIQKA